MREYRIVTNGLTYRIQWLGKTFLLRRPKWYYLRKYTYAGDYIEDYTTEMNARANLALAEKHDKAQKQGFLPI